MEDMARLALFEQKVKDPEIFHKTLLKLSEYIGNILENPDDHEQRTIKSDILKESMEIDALSDYLQYIGFQINDKEIYYPTESALNKLRMAQAAIDRKLYFCCGAEAEISNVLVKPSHSQPTIKKTLLKPVKVLNTNNKFLSTIENLFNGVLEYEDEELQKLARDQIPYVSLQLKAINRMREHQRKIKSGEIAAEDMTFHLALLMELIGWFKYSFFSWVDKPNCEECGGPTVFKRTEMTKTDLETCRLEMFSCTRCPGGAQFARHNSVRALLGTRRGRCGEWANCFAALARALGYETRYVYDVTDHVWCEIFDYDNNRWLHVDPCEAKLDTPLMYEYGWGKRLKYVIAFSRDDLQDVTWRYSSNHRAVRRRRTLCSEVELLESILALRSARQKQVSEGRRRHLAKRALEELVQIMFERKPSEYESHGRISGSAEWRADRCEIGNKNHIFIFDVPAEYTIKYFGITDHYVVCKDDVEILRIDNWYEGIFEHKNMFRKVEHDWRMVYLCREEGTEKGTISWRASANDKDVLFDSVAISANSAVYNTGRVKWTIQCDNDAAYDINICELELLADSPKVLPVKCREVVITAFLGGGTGDVGWQHAQLFRQSLDDDTCPFEVTLNLVSVEQFKRKKNKVVSK